MSESKLKLITGKLLAKAGLAGKFSLIPLSGGSNNRVYRIDGQTGHFVLKEYFQHRQDPRNRLATEYSFATYAWTLDVKFGPEPLAMDRQNNLAVYEYIAGRPFSPGMVDDAAVQTAIDFYMVLNAHRDNAAARNLPDASEACFSLCEHLETVRGRVGRLAQIAGQGAIDGETMRFVAEELVPAWRVVESHAMERIAALALDPGLPVPAAERRISPSDFGFHNAILQDNGEIRFVDFEYAGWDDPAKLVCDFFSQVAVPVSGEHYGKFARAIAEDLSNPSAQRERFELLLPVYRIKWITIQLNAFLPVGSSRRSFAAMHEGENPNKGLQLAHARESLARL